MGNLEYIAWTVGVGTGFLCFFVSVVVFTMWAKKEYSVRLAPGASFFFFWLRGFRAIYELNPSFISKKKKIIINPSHRKFRIHTREKEGVS